ncbi:MAG: dihydroneopterin triphosphate diphosphatase [Thiobacillus sp. SCN 64-35]|nr:dihydroneopterin triphosphate diphosphatase [Betaproteobacteria bacterium SCN1]MBN8761637.1 dihydroneopterin triphosphate diphosphatase [Thiobacillus sp.]ODU11335.1 MAG: dihydroneopterin triphosphate diphosphatase [Thiobacillus sp. SCN 64-35]ODU87328.1 MAG: dihydroneopterin triphosphate diphosphatase [Thiobacillus sp. SCN 65-179]OJW37233.1 MAG: dihydroneopterin triphosphate diphosphatase [Thiobacillus sp. 65-69]
MSSYKIPVSVLVVIHTADGRVLLMERTDAPGFWQSVTGSQDAGESLVETAVREVREETGFDATQFALIPWGIENRYAIYERWRHRYAPGVTHNTEHVFGLQLPDGLPPRLAPNEHLHYRWLPWDAAASACFSPSNAAAIRQLPGRLGLAA